jgi:hypothetical protein
VTAPAGSPAGPPYRVVHPITADAAIDAARLVMAPLRRRMALISLAALAAGIALTVAGDGRFGPGIALFGILTLGLTVLRGPERWLVNRRAQGIVGGFSELVLGDDGVAFASPQAAGRIPWSAITQVREDARSVVLLRDRVLVVFAPAAAFGPPERRAEIVAYARAKIAAAGGVPPA